MRILRVLLVGLALALALPAVTQATPKPSSYLVSLGDSYATGYQATGAGQGHNTRNGFAYGSVDELVAMPSGGLVPKPVAEICRLTYYCEFREIHARTSGYRRIAQLIVETLPERSARR